MSLESPSPVSASGPATTVSPSPAAPSSIAPGRATGPRSDAGKAIVAQNAIAHGLFSSRPVIRGAETEDEWHAYRDALLHSLAPADPLEHALAERAALSFWRLRRVTRYEAEATAISLEQIDADVIPHGLTTLRARLEEAEHALEVLQRFPTLPDNAPLPTADALLVLSHVGDETEVVALEDLSVPNGSNSIPAEQLDTWTVHTVRELLTYIASVNRDQNDDHRDVAALLAATTESATQTRSNLRRDLTRAEQKADRLHRERILPPPDAFDRVLRYEAHIGRQLTSALHELEALQSRRRGEPTPLARLDVSGTVPPQFAEQTP